MLFLRKTYFDLKWNPVRIHADMPILVVSAVSGLRTTLLCHLMNKMGIPVIII